MTFIIQKHDKNHIYGLHHRIHSVQYTIYQCFGQYQEQQLPFQ